MTTDPMETDERLGVPTPPAAPRGRAQLLTDLRERSRKRGLPWMRAVTGGKARQRDLTDGAALDD